MELLVGLVINVQEKRWVELLVGLVINIQEVLLLRGFKPPVPVMFTLVCSLVNYIHTDLGRAVLHGNMKCA